MWKIRHKFTYLLLLHPSTDIIKTSLLDGDICTKLNVKSSSRHVSHHMIVGKCDDRSILRPPNVGNWNTSRMNQL